MQRPTLISLLPVIVTELNSVPDPFAMLIAAMSTTLMRLFVMNNSEAKAMLVHSEFQGRVENIRSKLPHLQSTITFDDCQKPDPEVTRETLHEVVKPWRLNGGVRPYQPIGCLECRMTGYRGRAGLFELDHHAVDAVGLFVDVLEEEDCAGGVGLVGGSHQRGDHGEVAAD